MGGVGVGGSERAQIVIQWVYVCKGMMECARQAGRDRCQASV